MKNLLVLSTALLAFVSVDASASKLTGSEFDELMSYGARAQTIDEVIGVRTLQAQDNNLQNSTDDLVALRTRLVGDGTAPNVAAFQAVTHRTNAVTGLLPTVSDAFDLLDGVAGTPANVNTMLVYATAAGVFPTADDAGAGPNGASGLTSVGAGDFTPAVVAIPVDGSTVQTGTAFRISASMRFIYNRLFRDTAGAAADGLNLVGRQNQLIAIAAGYGFDGATLPTQDQLTLPMLAHFLASVDIDNVAR